MSRLLVVPPLQLDDIVPAVADPSDRVLDLLALRPNAVVSALSGLIVREGAYVVVFVEPVAGTKDGGYGHACVSALETACAARNVAVLRVAAGRTATHEHTLRITPDAQAVELLGQTPHGAARSFSLHPRHATLIETADPRSDSPPVGRWLPIDFVVSTIIDVVVEPDRRSAAVERDRRSGADAVLAALRDAAVGAVAHHRDCFVIATARLQAPGRTRRLLQWPGVAEAALVDARAQCEAARIPLWWDRVELCPAAVPIAVFPNGPVCGDALAADLLQLAGPGRSP